MSPDVATLEARINPGMENIEIHWYKENKEIYRGRKYEPIFWDNKVSLVIKDTEPTDSATYRVEVINQLGHVESQCRLTVHSEYQKMHLCLIQKDKNDILIIIETNFDFLSF